MENLTINYHPDYYNPGDLVALHSELRQAEMRVDTVGSLALEAGQKIMDAVTNRAHAFAYNVGSMVMNR